MEVKTRKAAQSQATRTALLEAARRLFAERGFAGTATEEIVQAAAVTRGALYHHFRDKEDLFRAVYQEIENELAERIVSRLQARAGRGASAWQEVREGAQAFLDVCLDAQIQRIALLEAPSVLGVHASRDIARFGLDLIRRGLERAIAEEFLEPQPVEPLAHVLRAALTEAAIYIARAASHPAARAEAGATIDRLLEGLRSDVR